MSNFQSLLDASTGHLRKQDRDVLERYPIQSDGAVSRNGSGAFIVYPYEYGWTVSTSSLMDGAEIRQRAVETAKNEGYSDEFIALMQYAAENKAVMIRFDADAEPVPGFPIFDENTDEPLHDGASPRL